MSSCLRRAISTLDLAPSKFADKPISRARALLVKLFDAYASLGYAVTKIEVWKLAYFLQIVGKELKLRYAKQQFGPYADQLRHVLTDWKAAKRWGREIRIRSCTLTFSENARLGRSARVGGLQLDQVIGIARDPSKTSASRAIVRERNELRTVRSCGLFLGARTWPRIHPSQLTTHRRSSPQ